jgi:hypothetical protein
MAGGALALVADAFTIIERQYAVAPSFAEVRHGAFQGLERALPPGTFGVGGGRAATVVSLRLPGEPAEIAAFSGATQTEQIQPSDPSQGDKGARVRDDDHPPRVPVPRRV